MWPVDIFIRGAVVYRKKSWTLITQKMSQIAATNDTLVKLDVIFLLPVPKHIVYMRDNLVLTNGILSIVWKIATIEMVQIVE